MTLKNKVIKANAPEKIYVALDELTEDERTFVLEHRVDYPICTEYIRKDVFIEKAKEFIWSHTEGSDYHVNYVLKEFENFMKGE